LRESNIPENYKIIYDNIRSEKIKKYLVDLGKRNKLPSLENLEEKLNKITHFVDENLATTNITDFDFDKLYNASIKWEESFTDIKQTKKEIKQENIAYGPKWKNEKYNGCFIIELKTDQDLILEGSDMSHCVGGINYRDEVRRKTKRIFSLRNLSNLSLVTIDASSDLFCFKQMFGRGNSQPNSDEMSMINEWKQALHPKDKVIELAKNSDNYSNKIKASQFMNYSDPEYKEIIDDFLNNEKDSSKEFIGHAANNDPKDVLQALASNETLDEICYEAIYMKCKGNRSTVFNLIRNSKISNELFRLIYWDTTVYDNNPIMQALLSSFHITKDENVEILKNVLSILDKIDQKTILVLLNNPSLKSSANIQIINILFDKNKDFASEALYKEVERAVTHLEPKFIDDLLESNNELINNKLFFNILIENSSIENNKKILEKMYKKFNIKSFFINKNDLIENILLENPKVAIENTTILLSDRKISNEELFKNINVIIDNEMFIYYNNISEHFDRISLSPEKVNYLLNLKESKDYNVYTIITRVLKTQKLTDEQINSFASINDPKDLIGVSYALGENKKLSERQLNYVLNLKIKNDKNLNTLLDNYSLNEEQINFLLENNKHYLYKIASTQPLKNRIFDKMIYMSQSDNNFNPATLLKKLTMNKYLNNENLDFLISKSLLDNSNDNIWYNNFDDDSEHDDLIGMILTTQNLTSNQIDKLLNVFDDKKAENFNLYINIIRKISLYQKITDEQLIKLINIYEEFKNITKRAIPHGGLFYNTNLTPSQITYVAKTVMENYFVGNIDMNDKEISSMLGANLPKETIDYLLSLNLSFIDKELIYNSILTIDQTSLLMKNYDFVNNEDLDKKTHGDMLIHMFINQKIDSKIIDHILNNLKNYAGFYTDIVGVIAEGQDLTFNQINRILNKNVAYSSKIASNKNIKEFWIDILLQKHDLYALDLLAMISNNLNSKQLDILLSIANDHINNQIAKNCSKLTFAQCIKLLKYKPKALLYYINNKKVKANFIINNIIKKSKAFNRLVKLI